VLRGVDLLKLLCSLLMSLAQSILPASGNLIVAASAVDLKHSKYCALYLAGGGHR
jgi:hypothetical protein